MRICPVCGNCNWELIYESPNHRIMTGDQRIIDGKLEKIVCKHCGILSNKRSFTNEEIDILYGSEYELNTIGGEEHYFYTTQGMVSRSKAFYDWIFPYLPKKFDTLIEIGCGEGNLLKHFKKHFKDKNILGFDGSIKACELARSKGLNVEQHLVLGFENLPKADVYVLVNVIEHVEDISQLILSLKKALNPNGRIIFCLPIQDFGGYDVFFAEHVWHFSACHVKNLIYKSGLELINHDISHPVNHGIGLFVCKIDSDFSEKNNIHLNASDFPIRNIDFWKKKFEMLNDFLEKKHFKQIAIFGAGEVATLFLTFTRLSEFNIVACIDDTKSDCNKKHGINVYNSEWLKSNQVDAIFLTVNQKYYQVIKDKLRDFNEIIFSVY